ncbi:MAG: c-type cytochrome [Flavobacterium sp.]
MKNTFLMSVVALLFIGCQKSSKENFGKPTETTSNQIVEKGKELFFGVGMCHTCHKTDQKIIGPSVVEIMKIYQEKDASVVSFLQGDMQPIVAPEQYEIMKANLAITKKMSLEELEALEAYMLSVVP